MRGKSIIFSSAYLKKLFFSYVLLLIPAFLIFTLITENFFSVQCRTLEDAMRDELAYFENQLRLREKEYELQAMYMSIKQEMAASRIMQHKNTDFKKILADAQSYTSLASEIIINYDQENIYIAAGMSRISTYLDRQMNLSNAGCQLFIDTLIDRTEKRLVLLPSSQNQGYLLYHYPVAMGRAANSASVNFLVNVANLGYSIKDFSTGYERRIYISLQDGACLIFAEDNEKGYTVQISTHEDIHAETGEILLLSENEYDSLLIATTLRTDLLYSKINHLRWVIFSVIALTLFIALGMALLFSRRNALPIQRLAHRASGGKPTFFYKEDEIGLIRRMIDGAMDDNHRMSREVEVARAVLGQQTMRLLLHGALTDPATIDSMLKLGGLELHESCFAVALIRPRAKPKDAHAWLSAFLSFSDLELGCVTTVSGEEVATALVGMPTQDLDCIHRLDFAECLEAACEDQGLDLPQVCFGRVYEEIAQVHQAYIEAVFTFKASANGSNLPGCLCFEEITARPPSVGGLSKEEDAAFHEALCALDKKHLEACMDQFQTRITQEEDASTQVMLRYSILQSLLRTLMEMGQEQEYVSELSKADPADEAVFNSQITLVLQRLCVGQPDPPDGVYQEILTYLGQRYTDQRLTLDDVAAHVSLSKAYISRLFRIKGNIKYIDYLTSLRMEEAMRLLRATRLPIREITHRVGYWDVVSFQKKFKALYGINPSEYRKQQCMEEEGS